MAEEESTIVTVRDLKRREPFKAFTIVMASGDHYLIEDPDALAIGGSQLHYYPRTGMGVHMRTNQVVTIEEPGESRSSRRRSSK